MTTYKVTLLNNAKNPARPSIAGFLVQLVRSGPLHSTFC